MVEHPLKTALAAAVPLCIAEIRTADYISEWQIERAKAFASDLGAHGDILLYGGGKKGDVAQLFERLAESIAVLACMPGDITIFGMHFEEKFK